MMDPDKTYFTTREKTFQYDDTLPSLPLPTLSNTLQCYLESVRPHVTDDEYQRTAVIVGEFQQGQGQIIHAKLAERAAAYKNWLSDWWYEMAYLSGRDPLPLRSIMAAPAPHIHHYWSPLDGTQLSRAALLIHFLMKFWCKLRSEEVRVDRDRKGGVFSMDQLYRAFNTTRVPRQQCDLLKHHFKTASEGHAPSHIIVLCRGHIFKLDTLDAEGSTLTQPELQQQLTWIRSFCDQEPVGPSVGTLTSENRTTWAEMRKRLVALHPGNWMYLEMIEQAAFVIVLDDVHVQTEQEAAEWSLAGDISNRWFDKSLTLIITHNGVVCSNADHAPVDGMVLVSCTYYIDMCIKHCHGEWQGSQYTRELPPPKELKFHLDDILIQGIATSKENYQALARDIEVVVTHFPEYGRSTLRRLGLHPDTHVQLALQYAYYRMHGRPAPTYETASTRRYYMGRTETLRSCTMEALSLAKAMCDPSVSVSVRRALYQEAAQKHIQLMEQCQRNEGCDRHLLGLYRISADEGMQVPDIFLDPTFLKSGGGGNFVLSTSLIGYTPVCGTLAPMVNHGYAIFYNIEPDSIGTNATAWRSCEETDARRFVETLHEALKELLSINTPSQQHVTAKL